jgi:hypothetical protein
MIKRARSEPSILLEERDSAHPGWWTTLATLATAWLGIPWGLPVALAVPWLLFRRRHRRVRLVPTLRWALAGWVTTVAVLCLAGERALRTIPYGTGLAAAAKAWLDGTGNPVPSWVAMVVWTALFAVGAVSTGGVVGCLVLASALLVSAVHASVILVQSSNVLHASLVALPLWSCCWLLGMILLLEPLAAWGDANLLRIRRDDAPPFSRRRWMVGGGLIAAALVTRLLAAPMFTDLARRLTIL